MDSRHQHQPGKDTAREQDPGHARADDVAHPHVLRGSGGANRGARIFLDVPRGCAGPGGKEVFILEQGIERAQSESPEDATGEAASAIAGDKHVGTGGAFGIGECAVLFHDELPPQRDHEKDADQSADEAKQKNAGDL